jgi:thiopurine S-methyltransferase
MTFNKDWWNQKYINDETRWDIGYPSTPLKTYIDQLTRKNQDILIPGCGNAYEAEYLIQKGFKNVFLIDWSDTALNNFMKRKHMISDNHLFCSDFFEHQGKYDIIIEQTFFCAIDPALRSRYANKVHELLRENGRLVGLLFDDKLNDDKPPFGGSKEEYITYFLPYFKFKVFETAYNSIGPREGREIFMILEKI